MVYAILEGCLNVLTAYAISGQSIKLKKTQYLKFTMLLIFSVVMIVGFNNITTYLGVDSALLNTGVTILIYLAGLMTIQKKKIQEALLLSLVVVIVIQISEFIAFPISWLLNNIVLAYFVSLMVHAIIIALILKYELSTKGNMIFEIDHKLLSKSQMKVIKLILAMLVVAATVGGSLITLVKSDVTVTEYIYITIAMIANITTGALLYYAITRTLNLENFKVLAANYQKMLETEKEREDYEKSNYKSIRN